MIVTMERYSAQQQHLQRQQEQQQQRVRRTIDKMVGRSHGPRLVRGDFVRVPSTALSCYPSSRRSTTMQDRMLLLLLVLVLVLAMWSLLSLHSRRDQGAKRRTLRPSSLVHDVRPHGRRDDVP